MTDAADSHVTQITTQVVAYEDGPECPTCGRPRVWRTDSAGATICGTGRDSGRAMDIDADCADCRRSSSPDHCDYTEADAYDVGCDLVARRAAGESE